MDTFLKLFQRVARGAGLDPSATLPSPWPGRITDAINGAMRWAWEHAFWPRVLVVEERTADSSGLIAWVQSGRAAIGAVDVDAGAFECDPRRHPRARAVPVFADASGVWLPRGMEEARVWLRWRPPAPSYASGDVAAAVPVFLSEAVALRAVSELQDEDQARFRTRAKAAEELARVTEAEFEVTGMGMRATR